MAGGGYPWLARLLLDAAVVLFLIIASALIVAIGVGYQLFNREHQDALRHADAIVVLGGEHDGREQYGLDLARAGYAYTVLISDPYHPRRAEDSFMDQICKSSTPEIEVICFQPHPSTTRGEAMLTSSMARQRGWHTIIVATWRFHIVRARYIFDQCFAGRLIMRSVPRSYALPASIWAYQYAYQYSGLAKAALIGC